MEHSGFSRQMIHYYTQLGLITEANRTKSGHRLYEESVFDRLERVKSLKAQGRSLLEIKEILSRENQEG